MTEVPPMSLADEIRVRDATTDDAREVARVHVDAWRVAYAGIIPDSLLASHSVSERAAGGDAWLRASVDERPTDGGEGPSHRLVVAEVAGNVIGWAAFGQGRDPGTRVEGELAGLYVDPAFWSRGVGRSLVDAVVDDLTRRGNKSAYVWVLRKNLPAIRFYTRLGWQLDGGEKILAIEGASSLEEDRLRRDLG